MFISPLIQISKNPVKIGLGTFNNIREVIEQERGVINEAKLLMIIPVYTMHMFGKCLTENSKLKDSQDHITKKQNLQVIPSTLICQAIYSETWSC